MIKIEIKQLFSAPKEKIMSLLLDHQQLDRFFNAKIDLIKPQDEDEIIGGKGAVRKITIGPIKFNEEIISANKNHLCYRIVGKGPVRHHQGDIYLHSSQCGASIKENETLLHYIIIFTGPRWLPNFLLKFLVARDIKKAIKKLAGHCHEC